MGRGGDAGKGDSSKSKSIYVVLVLSDVEKCVITHKGILLGC